MIAATLALARRPGETAYTISNYSFPVLPRVGEIICIQFCGAQEYRVRRVRWDAPVTAGPSVIGEVKGVTLECDPIDTRRLSAEQALPSLT